MNFNFLRKRHRKFSQAVSLLVTLMMILSSLASFPVMAMAEGGDDVTLDPIYIQDPVITGTNEGVGMLSEYSATFTLLKAIGSQNPVEDEFEPEVLIGFDCAGSFFSTSNEITNTDFEFIVDGVVQNDAMLDFDLEGDFPVLLINSGTALEAGQEVGIRVNLRNSMTAGLKQFATPKIFANTEVRTLMEYGNSFFVDIKPLTVVMTAVDEVGNSNGDINQNIRQKIKIELQEDGTINVTTDDISGCLTSDSAAVTFYPDKADVNPDSSFTLAAGESAAYTYFSCSTVGEQSIGLELDSNSQFAELPTNAPLSIDVLPVTDIETRMTYLDNVIQTKAGVPVKVNIGIQTRDGQENVIERDADIAVYLEAENTVTQYITPADGRFLAADAAGNPVDANGNSVDLAEDGSLIDSDLVDYHAATDTYTIKDEGPWVERIDNITPETNEISCYYYDTHATNDADYDVAFALSFGENLYYMKWDVAINPLLESANICLSALDGTTRKRGECFKLQAEFQDKYGNKVGAQPSSLTLDLSTDPDEAGEFYQSWNDTHNYPYDQTHQITFTGDAVKTFYYQGYKTGAITVKAATTDLQPGTIELNVLNTGGYLYFTADQNPVEINVNNKVTLELKNRDQDPIADHDGVTVKLRSRLANQEDVEKEAGVEDVSRWFSYDEYDLYADPENPNRPEPAGKFYAFNGDHFVETDSVYFPPYESQVEIYYCPELVGEHILCGYNYPDPYNMEEMYALEFHVRGRSERQVVTPAAGVCVAFDSEEALQFTAGQPGEVHLQLQDQDGNPVKTGEAVVDLFAEAEAETTGAFYASLDENGAVSGAPITQTTLVNGEATVYYLDNQATGPHYDLQLGVKSYTVKGDMIRAIVNAGYSSKLDIKVMEMMFYGMPYGNSLKIDNNQDYGFIMKGQMGADGSFAPTEDVAAGMPFPVVLTMLDENENPMTQIAPLTINLTAVLGEGTQPEDVYGGFYADPYGNEPVSQATIEAGEQTDAKLWFIPSGSGEVTLKAAVPGVQAATRAIQVHTANKVEIHFPLTLDVDPYEDLELNDMDKADLWESFVENHKIGPEDRRALYVMVMDEYGHPCFAEEDVVVNLAGTDFHQDARKYTPISTITIPAGYQGVRVFFEANGLEGTAMTMTATATAGATEISDTQVVQIVQEPYYTKYLQRGWNVISAPLQLSKKTVKDIVHDAENILEVAYAYNDGTKQWTLAGPDFALEPMDVIFVKLKGCSYAKIYPSLNPTGPYTRNLASGWNLIGPSLDMNNAYEDEPFNMASNQFSPYFEHIYAKSLDYVLESIQGCYSRVISPQIGEQNHWAYLPSMTNMPDMGITQGYWIYMNEPGTLVGYSYTPVAAGLSGYLPNIAGVAGLSFGMQAAETTLEDSPPPLPAAFYGTVVDTDGMPIESGTIEAVIDGVVRGSLKFTDGQFGLSYGARLMVQSLSQADIQNITFLIDGVPAQESFKFSQVSGELVEATLTVDKDVVIPIQYQSIKIIAPDQVALSFSTDISNHLEDDAALKDAITYAHDAENYAALGANDQVTIAGNQLLITFQNPLNGLNNKIKVAANTLNDKNGTVLTAAIETAAFGSNDQPIDECFIATAAYGSKFEPGVAILRAFRDQCLLTNRFGEQFVKFYYQHSPSIAKTIAHNDILKFMIRILLIPFIFIAYVILHPSILVMLLTLAAAGYLKRQFTIHNS